MSLTEVLDAYDAAWNERDERSRLAHLEQALADDGVYRDPMVEAVGRAALSDYIGQMSKPSGPSVSNEPRDTMNTTVTAVSPGGCFRIPEKRSWKVSTWSARPKTGG